MYCRSKNQCVKYSRLAFNILDRLQQNTAAHKIQTQRGCISPVRDQYPVCYAVGVAPS